jgi:hypothetical protein
MIFSDVTDAKIGLLATALTKLVEVVAKTLDAAAEREAKQR